jgi:VWFA-related protein
MAEERGARGEARQPRREARGALNSPGRWTLAALSLLVGGGWTLKADSRKPEAVRWKLEAQSGQPAAGRRPQQPPPPQTFRSGTQIVQVDVRVIRDGRFVTDLGPSDFTIKEDGVAQKIEAVVLVGAPSAPSAPAPPAPSPLSAPALPAASAPPVWVFVFDTEHLSPGGLNRSRDAIVTFIRDRFRQGDIGGVVFDGRMANNRLTSDRAELRTAAAAVKMPGELRSRQLELHEWPRLQDDDEAWRIANGDRESLKAAVTRACSEDPDQCRVADPAMQVLEKAKRLDSRTQLASLKTLTAVEALSKGLARMPGAKTVVFFSEGFALNDKAAELRQAVGMAARAGAHVYAIDARGLNKGSASAALFDQPVVSGNFGQQQSFDTQADGMNSLAVDTGGFAIRNENDFARALEQIQQDSSTYYVVSYAAANGVFDGKYRAIDVSVDRPGVKVRARRGYLAVDPAVLLRPAPIAASRGSAVATPDLPLSPGLMALPEAPLPGGTEAIAGASPAGVAVRAHVDGGKVVTALGRTSVSAGSAAERGWSAYEKGDVVTAAKHLSEAASAPDARPWVHYALGLAEFAQQHYKEASIAWERVLRDVPEFEPIYFSLADAYGLQHDEGTALKILREAARRWPTDPEVFDAIGVLQVKRGALDAAVDSFDTATKIAPQEALGWFNLGRTLQMRWLKAQRYDKLRERWIGPDDDRKRAAAAYQKCLDIGGPYDAAARQALTALAWR